LGILAEGSPPNSDKTFAALGHDNYTNHGLGYFMNYQMLRGKFKN
jgi:hypothetical protein